MLFRIIRINLNIWGMMNVSLLWSGIRLGIKLFVNTTFRPIQLWKGLFRRAHFTEKNPLKKRPRYGHCGLQRPGYSRFSCAVANALSHSFQNLLWSYTQFITQSFLTFRMARCEIGNWRGTHAVFFCLLHSCALELAQWHLSGWHCVMKLNYRKQVVEHLRSATPRIFIHFQQIISTYPPYI